MQGIRSHRGAKQSHETWEEIPVCRLLQQQQFLTASMDTSAAMMAIELDLLHTSDYEHTKFVNDASHYMPATHPKMIAVRKEQNAIAEKINRIVKTTDSEKERT